jgi:hypothetical protein
MRPGSICGTLSILACSWLFVACATTDGTTPSAGSASTSSTTAPAGGSQLPTKATAVSAAAAAERSFAAAGTQGDTLQACLDRIPKDASAGQRSVAESTCRRDHAGQRSISLVPGK